MVNKEFIVGSGGIIKDFTDRNIPQNSNNFVSVGVLIPVSEFDELNNYSVLLATSKIISGVETSLPSLITYSAKTLKIEGVDYIKFQCQLSISYTNFIGQLKLTPYIVETTIENEGEEDEEVVITTQKTFTNTTLNVIRSIASTSDASLEEAEAVETLTALIEAKNIKLIEDYKNGTKAQAIIGCFTDYNASYYEGWLLIVKYSGGEIALLPYKNSSANEFTEIDLDGSIYKLSDYSSGTYTSTLLTASKDYVDTNFYKKTETYSDDEVDALLNAKVDKTTKVNGHALSGDVDVSKSDVGLGNVENYGIVNSPSADATNKYVDAGGLYTYLITNYADKSDYDTTKAKVNELYESFKGTGDNDNVVNTLYDLIKVFENFDEADNVASILSGLDSRLDVLESEANVVINCGSASITSWSENSDSYASDYPYKATITKDALIGAMNFDVIFSVDADTSLLSTTAILDNETGTITFYASDEPSDTIAIDNIVAFTNLNAINTLTTDTINQVAQNKNDISDLQQNKANKNDYVAKEEENTPSGWNFAVESLIGRKATTGGLQLKTTRKNTTDCSEISMPYGAVRLAVNDNGNENVSRLDKDGLEITIGQHVLTFDANGDLKVDGNAVGGGGLTIPTITILATQQNTSVLPDINYDLTQEQIDAFNDNNVVEVILPDGTDYLYQANITSDTIQWGIKVFQKIVVGTDATGDYAFSKSLVFITDNITINETTIRASKQLYQHNIYMSNNNSANMYFAITIINDSITKLESDSAIRQWLASKGFEYKDNSHNWHNAIGNWSYGTSYYDIVGVEFNENQNALFWHGIGKDGTSTQNGTFGSQNTFKDIVITL